MPSNKTWLRNRIEYDCSQVDIARDVLEKGGKVIDVARSLNIPRHRAEALISREKCLSSIIDNRKEQRKEQDKRIIKMHNDGFSMPTISSLVGVDFNRVYYVVNNKI